MRQLLFGTNNRNKLIEIREILKDQFQVLGLADLSIDLDPEETEDTLAGNALLKARAFQQASGIPCFADDTGLDVDALDGRPGVYSARYAGPGATYMDNVNKLLGEMQGKEVRSARFRTVIAFVDGQQEWTFEGKVEGQIIDVIRGEGGFGYDPVFLPDGHEETFAEMPSATKHAISHRGRAVRAFAEFLKTY